MIKKLTRIIAIICIIALLCSNAFAAMDASTMINSYDTDARHTGGGTISMLVSVFAKDYMDELGASNIFVYEKVGSAWIIYETFTKSDNGMMSSDSAMHDDYVTCNAYTGGEFKVQIVIFATNYSGETDSRSETHYVYT